MILPQEFFLNNNSGGGNKQKGGGKGKKRGKTPSIDFRPEWRSD